MYVVPTFMTSSTRAGSWTLYKYLPNANLYRVGPNLDFTNPEAVEVDLNPVRLTPQRCVVLEMRIRVERRPPPQRVKTW